MADVKTCEEEVRRARAKLDLNLERLQSELSVERVVGESVSALKRTSYGGVAGDLLGIVRGNPVPALIAGAAAALLLGQFAVERTPHERAQRRRARRSAEVRETAGAFSPTGPTAADPLRDHGAAR